MARHSSWVGGKNSAFQEPGPTAQANNALVASVLESVVARSLSSWYPTGRSATPATGPGMIAPSRTTGPLVS